MACRSDQLLVYTIDELGRIIVNSNIGVELLVLERLAVAVERSDLRNAEDDRRVNLSLPPHGCHRSRHGSTDKVTYSKCFIGVGRSVSVAVVALVDEHDRRLGPLRERVTADIASAGSIAHIFLSAQQQGNIVVEPASAVVACVDNDSLAVAIFSEDRKSTRLNSSHVP